MNELEWIWRIASVIILPLLAWIALILRDIERRLGKVEVRVEAIEIGARNDRQNRRDEHIEFDRVAAHARELRDCDREKISEILTQLAEVAEAVRQLKDRIDRGRM